MNRLLKRATAKFEARTDASAKTVCQMDVLALQSLIDNGEDDETAIKRCTQQDIEGKKCGLDLSSKWLSWPCAIIAGIVTLSLTLLGIRAILVLPFVIWAFIAAESVLQHERCLHFRIVAYLIEGVCISSLTFWVVAYAVYIIRLSQG